LRPGADGERASRDVERRNRELEALNAVAATIGRWPDIEITARETLDVVCAVAGMDVGAVYRLDRTSGTLVLLVQRGLTPELAERIRVRPVDSSHVGEAVRTGRFCVAHLGRSRVLNPSLRDMAEQREHRTQAALPVPVRGEIWGVMALVSRERRHFDSEEIRILDAVSHQVGLAVERAALMAETREKSRRLESLARVAQRLSATLSLSDVLDIVVAAAAEFVPDGALRVWLAEDDRLVARPVPGQSATPEEVVTSLTIGEGLAGRAAATRAPVVVDDLAEDPRAQGLAWAHAQGYAGAACVPLFVRDRLIGVLSVFSRTPRRFGPEEIDLFVSFGNQAAVAIENARLFETAAARLRRLEALREIESRISEQLDLSHLLELIARSAGLLVGGASSTVYLREGEMLEPRAWDMMADWIREVRVPVGAGLVGTVAEQRRGLIVNDYPRSPYAISPFAQAVGRALAQPLLAGERAVGVLVVNRESAMPPFTEEDLTTLGDLAGQAAVAIGNARLFESRRAYARRLTTLHEVNRAVSASLDLDTVLVTLAKTAADFFGAQLAAVWVLDETGAWLVRRGTAGERALEENLLERVAFGEGAIGWIAKHQMPLISANVASDDELSYREWALSHGLQGFTGMPLVVGDRLVGVLTLNTRETAPLASDQVTMVQAVAAQAAIGIENARLFAEASRRAAEYRALYEVGNLVSSTLDVGRVLDLIVERCGVLMGVPAAGIFRYDPEAGMAVFERGVGLSPEFMASLRVRLGEGTTGRALALREAVWSGDLASDPAITLDEATRALIRREGYRAVLSVPILIKGEPYGVLAVYWWEPHTAAASEVELMTALAGEAAIAIDNARLYREATAQASRMRSLADLGRTLVSTFDADRVLEIVATQARERLGIDRIGVFLRDREAGVLRLARAAGTPDGLVHLETLEPGEGIGGRAYEEGRAVWTSHLLDDPAVRLREDSRRRIAEAGSVAALGLPLMGEEPLGALVVLRPPGYRFSEAEVEALSTFANQVAVALENARLYGQVRDRLRETSTLLAVGQALSERLPADEVMRRVAREVGRSFDADTVGVYVLDERREALRPLAGYHVPPEFMDAVGRFELARFPWMREVCEGGRAAWCADVPNDPRFDAETARRLGSHSLLFAPTLVRGRAVGGLFLVWWRRGRSCQADEVRLIEGVAAQVGLAMENAELARETERKLRETEALLSVSRTLGATLEFGKLPRILLRHLAQSIGADSVGLWLLDESGGWLEPAEGYHVPPDRLEALRQVRVSMARPSVYADAARQRQAVFSPDVGADLRFPREIVDAVPHKAQLFVPVVAKDRLLGAFVAAWWERARHLTPSDLALAEGIASQAGVALDNARLFRDNARRVEELSVLHELSQAVTGQLDQAGLLETVHRQVARVLDARHLVILLLDETGGELEVVLRVRDGVRVDGEPRRYGRGEAGLSSVVLESGRPLRTGDYVAECARRGVSPVSTNAALPFWLGVPMLAEDQVLGVLALRGRERAFGEADERLLANIAHLAALALRSARLYTERARAYSELAAAQEQLIRREKLSALGEMASGVAHDFNNLLASIVGRAQLLLLQVQDPKHRQWLQVIERSALDGAKTVRRLQEFTRVRRDQAFVPVDLGLIVHETLEVTETRRNELLGRGIAVEVETALAADLPPVPGDPVELREALTNLVLNALDAMPEGGTLTLTTRAGEAERVELAVADTGIGMPAHVKQRIFDPFFTTKGSRGTGLGLSMAYGILSRHGVRVDVHSVEGQGTTFRLSFPVARAPAEPVAPAPSAPAAAPALACLVVDDEVEVGDTLGDVLTSCGHRAVVVRDGAEAVARFRAEPFDAVFTDLSMPGLSGWEVAKRIKAVARAVPVFLCTGLGVEVSADELRANGVDAVLAKPLRLEDVQAAVATVGPGRRG
jgi:GAF domain-containing protein/ActR/RegA family two-component response regulator